MAGDIFVTFGGDTADLEATLASAKASVNAFTAELRSLARQQHDTGASADSELGQKMLAVAGQLSEAKEGVTKLKTELKGAGGEGAGGLNAVKEAADSVKESLLHLAEAAGIAFSLEALKEWIVSSAELGERMETVGAQLGTSAHAASELSGMAKLSGTDFDSLARTMSKFELSLASADAEGSKVRAGLQAMGLEARQFIGVPMPQQLEILAGAMAKFEDSSTKTAAAEAILGKNGAEMIAFLDKGKVGFEDMRETLAATGAVMSNQMAAGFAHTKEDLSTLSLAWQGLSNRIFQVVRGPIEAAIEGLTRLIEKMDVGAVRTGVSALTGTAIDLATSVRVFSAQATDALSGLIDKVNAASAAFAKMRDASAFMRNLVFNPVQVGMDTGVKVADRLRDALAGAGTAGTSAFGELGAGITPLETKINDLLGAAMMAKKEMNDLMGAPTLPGGRAGHEETSGEGAPKPQVPAMDLGGAKAAKDAAEAVKQAFAEEVQQAQDAAKQIEGSLDEELKTHQITMQQWLAQTTLALDHEQDAIQDAAQKAIDSAKLTAEQKKAIAQKEAHDIAEIAHQEQQAQSKAAEQAAQQWQSFESTVTGAFNSQIHGLLAGTTTFAGAFRNMTSQLAEHFITFAADIALNWILTMTGMKTAVATFNTALAPLMAAGTASSAVASKPGIMAEISADVGAAYAGFAAFLAPVMGPAAPGVAAGLAAGVGATATSMAAFDIGAYNVPRDQVALVHQNELVMPAAQANAFRSMLEGGGVGGGGATHNWNIQALDARSFVQMLGDNSSALARQLARTFNQNPSLRPSY